MKMEELSEAEVLVMERERLAKQYTDGQKAWSEAEVVAEKILESEKVPVVTKPAPKKKTIEEPEKPEET